MINELIPNFLFSKMIQIDNKKLLENCLELEKYVIDKNGEQEISTLAGSYTTQNFSKYNFFSYHTQQTSDLLENIREVVKPLLPEKQYVIQCWLNVFKKGSFIDWHGHWESSARAYHGYYCVNVGNSYTSYKIPPDIQYDVQNKNGLLVFGKSDGDKHKSSEWDEDFPRITIAFDLIPVVQNSIQKTYNEHYIPF